MAASFYIGTSRAHEAQVERLKEENERSAEDMIFLKDELQQVETFSWWILYYFLFLTIQVKCRCQETVTALTHQLREAYESAGVPAYLRRQACVQP